MIATKYKPFVEWVELLRTNLIYNNMDDSKKQENGRDQQVRIQCIDYATRVVGKPEYLMIDGKVEKQHEDVVEVAKRIHEFVTG